VELRILPFTTLRDFHGNCRAADAKMTVRGEGADLAVTSGSHTLHMHGEGTRYVSEPRWWYGQVYAIETDRGLDDSEDVYNPGYFTATINGSATLTFWAALEPNPQREWDSELARRRKVIAAAPASITLKKLTRAANDFVVYRKSPDG